jgi:hypothetical protein
MYVRIQVYVQYLQKGIEEAWHQKCLKIQHKELEEGGGIT